ncbi:MAG TPA: DUF6176 family protein [Longimicrobiales bacterium]|nr:DUF6176 family protein [Longimicrobiales bacterium]
MSEVQCLRIRLAPGRTDEVADFLRGLRNRADEVQEALKAEGILEETLFLDRTAEEDCLVFFTRARDLAAAAAAFQSSQLPLDVETRELIADTWQEVRALELLVDLEG